VRARSDGERLRFIKPPIVTALEKLPAKALILDGEMIAPEPDRRPNFHEIHSRMAWNAELLAFVAFDILHRDGQDLRTLPATDRKAILWELVKPADGIIQYSQHVEGDGAAFYGAAEKMGLEGVVSKRRDSPYRSGGKDEAWVKVKCRSGSVSSRAPAGPRLVGFRNYCSITAARRRNWRRATAIRSVVDLDNFPGAWIDQDGAVVDHNIPILDVRDLVKFHRVRQSRPDLEFDAGDLHRGERLLFHVFTDDRVLLRGDDDILRCDRANAC